MCERSQLYLDHRISKVLFYLFQKTINLQLGISPISFVRIFTFSIHKKFNDLSFRNIPSTRSLSHESLFVCNGPLGSILPAKPAQIMLENCHICRLHPSIIQSSDFNDDHSSSYQYIEIRNNKDENENYYLRSKQYLNDNTLLLNHLRHTRLEKNIDGLRIDNSLDIWILEAKGLPNKKK